jgi:hypothetical protein
MESKNKLSVSYRDTPEKTTTGIFLWSEVYNLHVKDGREVAVVLLDIQVMTVRTLAEFIY